MHIADQPYQLAQFHGYQALPYLSESQNDLLFSLQLHGAVNARIENIKCFVMMIFAFFIFTYVHFLGILFNVAI